MMFMNEWEIADAAQRYRNHPLLGPATRTLVSLKDAANANSDGWAYWPKPARAAAQLQRLIVGDGTAYYRFDEERADVTAAKLRAAYAPLRAFRTRQRLAFTIYEPGGGQSRTRLFGRTASRARRRAGVR